MPTLPGLLTACPSSPSTSMPSCRCFPLPFPVSAHALISLDSSTPSSSPSDTLVDDGVAEGARRCSCAP